MTYAHNVQDCNVDAGCDYRERRTWLLKVGVGACVKNKLRSTMPQDRLECLLLMASAEKDVLLNLSVDEVVSKFASSGDRRLDLG